MSGGIFISYRRNDTSSLAGRLYDRLLENFPQDKIFMDLDRVAVGEELVKTIRKSHRIHLFTDRSYRQALANWRP